MYNVLDNLSPSHAPAWHFITKNSPPTTAFSERETSTPMQMSDDSSSVLEEFPAAAANSVLSNAVDDQGTKISVAPTSEDTVFFDERENVFKKMVKDSILWLGIFFSVLICFLCLLCYTRNGSISSSARQLHREPVFCEDEQIMNNRVRMNQENALIPDCIFFDERQKAKRKREKERSTLRKEELVKYAKPNTASQVLPYDLFVRQLVTPEEIRQLSFNDLQNEGALSRTAGQQQLHSQHHSQLLVPEEPQLQYEPSVHQRQPQPQPVSQNVFRLQQQMHHETWMMEDEPADDQSQQQMFDQRWSSQAQPQRPHNPLLDPIEIDDQTPMIRGRSHRRRLHSETPPCLPTPSSLFDEDTQRSKGPHWKDKLKEHKIKYKHNWPREMYKSKSRQ